MTIRTILEELVNDIQGGALTSWSKEKVDEAEDAILASLIAKLPKRRDEKDFVGACSPCDPNPKNCCAVTYNKLLAKVKAMLMEKEKI